MAANRKRTRKRQRSVTEDVLGWLIPFVVVGLAIADFADDGKIDKYLIGALLLFGFGALGLRLDDIVAKQIAAKVEEATSGDPAEGEE